MPVGVRSPLWPALTATLTILGLLPAFHQVVSGAVQQGKLRHQASALHSKVNWNGNTLGSLRVNQSCLSPLKALARVHPLLQACITPGLRPEKKISGIATMAALIPACP